MRPLELVERAVHLGVDREEADPPRRVASATNAATRVVQRRIDDLGRFLAIVNATDSSTSANAST